MKLAIMQPYFFPYLGYFQLMDAVDKIILYDYVHYIKKGWIKRNRILEQNHGAVWIVAPVCKESSHTRISETKIDVHSAWQKKLLNLLEHNYKNAPYYHEIMPILRPFLERQFSHLATFNFESIRTIAELLDMNVSIEYGSSRFLDIEQQLEESLTQEDHRSLRIWKICEREKADSYINPIGGKELYDKQQFADQGIRLFFLQTKAYSYKQVTGDFIPDLSIIDVLCNCGIQQTQKLLKNYQLV